MFLDSISVPKSSYIAHEKIDFQFIYDCDLADGIEVFQQVDYSNGSYYSLGNLYNNSCFNNPTRWNITNDHSFLNGTRHLYSYYLGNSFIDCPFLISNKHSPDIKVPEKIQNFVGSGEVLIFNSQIRNLDGELDACIYTQLNSNPPKRHECLHYDDGEWHDFTLKIDTNGLSDAMQLVGIYAIQGSEDYRTNIVYN